MDIWLCSTIITMTLTDGTQTQSHTFAITKPSYTTNTAGGGFNIFRTNGAIQFPTGDANQLIAAPGQAFTISGMGGGFAVYNKTWSPIGYTVAGQTWAQDPGSGPTGNPGGYTITAYPPLTPMVTFCTDSQGTAPGNQSRALLVDFFSLVYNKGLQTGGATPNSVKQRYW